MQKSFKKAIATFLIVLMLMTSVPLNGFIGIDWSVFTASAVEENIISSLEDIINEKDEENLPNFQSKFEEDKSDFSEFTEIVKDEAANVFSLMAEKKAVHTQSVSMFSLRSVAPVSEETDFSWEYDEENRTLTVRGTGDMPDYTEMLEQEGVPTPIAPWAEYAKEIEKVVIEAGITSIGDCAFALCTNVKEVVLPEGITSIGAGAFAYCVELVDINLPSTLISVDQMAFGMCWSVKELVLPDSIETIGDMAFMNMFDLEKINLPASLQVIGEGPLTYALSLKELIVPEGLKIEAVYDAAETFAMSLEHVTNYSATFSVDMNFVDMLGGYFDSVEYADAYCCLHKNYLKYEFTGEEAAALGIEVSKQELIEDIINYLNTTLGTNYAVADFESFEHVLAISEEVFASHLIEISGYPSYFSVSCLENSKQHELCRDYVISHNIIGQEKKCICFSMSGTIGDNITWFVDGETKTLTFDGSGEMSDFDDVPEYVKYSAYIENISFTETSAITSIGAYAFYGLTNVEKITLPEGIETLGEACFYNSGLKILNIPASLTNVYVMAFYMGTAPLEEINVAEGNEKFISYKGSLYVELVEYEGEMTYILYKQPEKHAGEFIDNTIGVFYCAFENYSTVTEITVPDTVLIMTEGAFLTCSSLETINIGNSKIYEYDGENASLEIDEDFVVKCNNLTAINVDERNVNYTSVDGVLYNKAITEIITVPTGIAEVVVPETVISLPGYAFDYAKLEKITILNLECEIRDESFAIYRNATICGYKDSTAEAYADKYNRNFEYIGDVTVADVEFDFTEAKKVYGQFSNIDTSGIKVTLIFSDGTTSVKTSGFNVSGFDSDEKGEQTVTVTYRRYSDTYTVTVTEPFFPAQGGYKYFYIDPGETLFVGFTPEETKSLSLNMSGYDNNTEYYVTVYEEDKQTVIYNGILDYSNPVPVYSYEAGKTYYFAFSHNRTDYDHYLSVELVQSHNYYVSSSEDATCTEDGYITYTCSDCGDSYTSYITPYHTDSDGNRICEVCGKTSTYEVEFNVPESITLDTDYETLYAEFTPTFSGYYRLSSQLNDSNYHYVYFNVYKNGSYISSGYGYEGFSCYLDQGETYTIRINGGEGTFDMLISCAHQGEWGYTVEPTCTEYGEKTRACTQCGETETAVAYSLGHDYSTTTTKEATCTETGTQIIICSRCDYSYENEVAKLSHTDEDNDGICEVCSGNSSDILSGETKYIEIAPGYVTTDLRFVPEKSGKYNFYSSADSDTYGYLYDADKNQIAYDDDNGEGHNFFITYELEAGKVYYWGARYYGGGSGWFNVTLEYACEHLDEDLGGVCDECGESSIVASGICGDNLTWTLYGTTLVINGEGTMYDYVSEWDNYTVRKVIVSEGVENIGDCAFDYNSNLTEVSLPSTLKNIGYGAFYSCSAFATVNLPEGLEGIESYAFYGTAIESVVIPSGVKYIYSGTFGYCKNLSSVTLNEGLLSIYGYAFGDTSVETVTIPSTVTALVYYAFGNSVKNYIVHEDNEYYSNDENGVLFNKDKTSLIVYPSSNTAISYVIPETVKTIGTEAFEGSTNLTSVTIPDSVEYIYSNAFSYTGITGDYILSENVSYIGCCSFGNTSLNSITVLNKNCNFESYFLGDSTETLVKGNSGSTAEDTAERYGYTFESLDDLTVIGIEFVTMPRTRFYNTGDYFSANGLTILVTYSDSSTATKQYYSMDISGEENLQLGTNTITVSYKGQQLTYDIEYLEPAALEFNEEFNLTGATSTNNITVYKFTPESTGYYWFFNDADDYVGRIDISGNGSYDDEYQWKSYCWYLEGGEEYTVRIYSGEEVYCIIKAPNVCTFGEMVTTTKYTYGNDYCVFTPSVSHYYAIDNPDQKYIMVYDGNSYIYSGSYSRPTVYLEEGKEYLISTYASCEFAVVCNEHDYVDEILRETTCARAGLMMRTCVICERTYQELIPALEHTFGEWITEAPTVVQEGKNTRTCSACGYTETEKLDRLQINWEDDEGYGLVNFTVVDAQTLDPLSNAWISVVTEEGETSTYATDSEGKVSIVLPVGEVKFTAGGTGKITRTLKYNILHEEFDAPLVGLSSESLIDTELTVEEMTYQEIIDAGIDVENPENKHFVKYTVTFVYEGEERTVTYYEDDNNERYYSNSSDSKPDRPDGGYVFGDDIVYVSEKFYLIVHGQVSWLKQMFNVEMKVYNNSLTDTFENVEATLILPEGLSLADMVHGQQTLTQELGIVSEGGETVCNWYVRGDEAGVYSISANLRGMLMPYSEEFDHTYVTESPIKVYDENALRLYASAPNFVCGSEDYEVIIGIENISDTTLYNVSHIISDMSQCVVRHYQDGTVIKEVYAEETIDSSAFAQEFKPGDKLELTIPFTVLFNSEVYKDCIYRLVDVIIDAEKVKTDIENKFDVPDEHTLGEYTEKTPASCEENGVKVAVCETCGYEATEIILALGHNYENDFTVDIEPDCVNEGSKSRHCTRCDEKTDVTPIPTNDEHDLGEWYEYKAAACKTDGDSRRDCSRCEYYESQIIPELDHDMGDYTSDNNGKHTRECQRDNCIYTETADCDFDEWATVNESTCTVQGDKVRACAVCEYKEIGKLSLKEHTLGEEKEENRIEATCEEDGSYDMVVRCTVCNTVLSSETVTLTKLGHDMGDYVSDNNGKHTRECRRGNCTHTETADCDFGEWVTVNESTCTIEGDKERSCTVCSYKETGKLPLKEHVPGEEKEENRIEATCETDGSYDMFVRCTECNTVLSSKTETLTKLGHDWDEGVVTTVATCVDKETTLYTCQNNNTHQKTEIGEVNPDNHTGGTYLANVKDVSCTEDGYTGDTHCDSCKAKLADGEAVEKLGHDPVEYTQPASCTVNGYTMINCTRCYEDLGFEVIEKLSHDMGDYISDNNGEHTRECQRDNCTYTETVDCVFGEWITVNESTCTIEGDKERICTVCEYKEAGKLPLADHILGEEKVENRNEATCEADGSYDMVVRCTECNTVLSSKTEILTKLGHDWDEGVVTTVATCTVAEEKLYTCKRDAKHTKTETGSVDVDNHTGGTYLVNEKEVSCTEDGYTGDTYCNSCKIKLTDGEAIGKLGHDGVIYTQLATCTVNGYIITTCIRCYEELDYETLTKLGHDMSDYVSDNNGEHTRECKRDNCTYTETVDCVFGEWITVNESTCTIEGDKERICTVCEHKETGKLPLADHTHGEEKEENRNEATCEVDGSYDKVIRCTVCATVLSSETVILTKLGHDWDEGRISSEGTCIKEAVILYTCKRNVSHTKNENGQKNPDNHTGGTYLENIKDATCVLDGYSGDTYCNDCKKLISTGNVIEKLGHNMGTWQEIKKATLLEEGQESCKCSRCDYTETRSIPRLEGKKTEDDKSGVSVEYTSDSYDADVNVKVEEVFDGSQYMTQQYANIKTWNIKTYIGDTEVQPDVPVLVRIPLPADYNTTTIAVFHIDSETGKRERVQPVIIENGYICFLANSFSLYILVDESSVIPEQPSEPDTPDDPSENCYCNCHKSGFMGLIWKILRFFYKLFGTNKICSCGATHY